MQYWRKLTGDWHDCREELVLSAALHGITTHVDSSFIWDARQDLWTEHLPKTRAWIQALGYEPEMLFWIICTETQLPHIDILEPTARINFPVINCQYSATDFFRPASLVQKKTVQGIGYYQMPDCDQLVTSVTLDCPTVLMVSEPHRVRSWLPPGMIRVSASIRTEPSCRDLLYTE